MNRVLCRDDTNRSHGQFKEVLDLPPPFAVPLVYACKT